MNSKRFQLAILGDGQLATMLKESAENLNVDIKIFPLPKINNEGEISQDETKNWIKDLAYFDAVTFEIENIPVNFLREIEKTVRISPSIYALEVAQDRLKEKNLCDQLSIPTNNYFACESLNDLNSASLQLDFPFILKTRRFGYDGKGQFVIKNNNEIKEAWDELKNAKYLIAESFVSFDFEVSQIATRNQNGEIVYYPLVRNEHREGILRETHVLDFPNNLVLEAKETIKTILEHFNYIGTLAVEFFVKENQLFVNEMAPRVHNSGHWSINGTQASQFENHIRAVCGFDLGSSQTIAKNMMMINLIGEDVPESLQVERLGVYSKSYHKGLRENRKMGHINIVSNDINDFKEKVDLIYEEINAKPCLSIDKNKKDYRLA